jgi:hypothetical protein
MWHEELRTVAYIRPSNTAWIAGGMPSTPPIRVSVRLRALMTSSAADAMSSAVTWAGHLPELNQPLSAFR